MITEFPEFTPVTLSNLPGIVELNHGYEHYAGFDSVLLWCWNREYPGGVSQLYGNLVVMVKDPMNGDPFLSFTPRHAVRQTVTTLLDYADHHDVSPCLRAIPGSRRDVPLHASDAFDVHEDRDAFEYVLSVADWVQMPGHEFRNKRHAIHRLERCFSISSRELSLEDEQAHEDMLRLCHLWAKQRGVTPDQFHPELTAIQNLFDYRPSTHLFILGAYVDDTLVGFSANAQLDRHMGVGHFAKADYRYQGLYIYLLHNVCMHLQQAGVTTLNVEDDLGIPGLRQAKLLLKPVRLLEKIMICPRSG